MFEDQPRAFVPPSGKNSNTHQKLIWPRTFFKLGQSDIRHVVFHLIINSSPCLGQKWSKLEGELRNYFVSDIFDVNIQGLIVNTFLLFNLLLSSSRPLLMSLIHICFFFADIKPVYHDGLKIGYVSNMNLIFTLAKRRWEKIVPLWVFKVTTVNTMHADRHHWQMITIVFWFLFLYMRLIWSWVSLVFFFLNEESVWCLFFFLNAVKLPALKCQMLEKTIPRFILYINLKYVIV